MRFWGRLGLALFIVACSASGEDGVEGTRESLGGLGGPIEPIWEWDCPHSPYEEGSYMPKRCHPYGHCVGTVCDDPHYAYCCSRYDNPQQAWDAACVAAAKQKC